MTQSSPQKGGRIRRSKDNINIVTKKNYFPGLRNEHSVDENGRWRLGINKPKDRSI